MTTPLIKVNTKCCALSQISAGDDTPITEIAEFLRAAQNNKGKNWFGKPTGDGETTFFCIVTPSEKVLEQKLITLGFTLHLTFERRSGYPATGDLKMYVIKIWKQWNIQTH